jgi:sulfoxide reductase heme-binding subunit YedZ
VSTQILWFTTRGAGVVSLILFSAVACLGLLAVARTQSTRWPRFLTVELHRNLALLSVAFLGIHIVTAIVDPFTSLGLGAALVPLASSYRPLPVAFGVVSVYLVLAVIVTSLLRERIGHGLWRAVHWAAYAAWPLAVEHTLTAGSDGFSIWLLAVQGSCVLAVSLAWRND